MPNRQRRRGSYQQIASSAASSSVTSATNSTIGSEELGNLQKEVIEEYEDMLRLQDFHGSSQGNPGKSKRCEYFMDASG